MKPVFAVWLRNDFRLTDHPAIQKAVEAAQAEDGEVTLFFHLHPDFLSSIDLHHDYFFQTLRQFQLSCRRKHIQLNIIHGELAEALGNLTTAFPSLKAVFYLEDFTPFGRSRDKAASDFFTKHHISPVPLEGSHIVQPDRLVKNGGQPYKVFTPYFRQWRQLPKPERTVTNVDALISLCSKRTMEEAGGEHYFTKTILPRCTKKWAALGEDEALDRLESFLDERLTDYNDLRDRPDYKGTSMLSPYIKTGALSVQTLFHAVSSRLDQSGKGAETYLKELAWRDFYAMVYFFYPETKNEEFQKKYRKLEWSRNDALLKNWQDGETGFPIVDAGMRQLNTTGWMHNRLRMVVSSFLTKDYLIDWRLGEAYFAEKLIDYDEASNIGGWQWASSVGTDAVPYFRVFNPERQSERFDPDGRFIKKYVNELKHVPSAYIHNPEKMPDSVQKDSGCGIGRDYPAPVVDHAVQRKKAISLFKGDDD